MCSYKTNNLLRTIRLKKTERDVKPVRQPFLRLHRLADRFLGSLNVRALFLTSPFRTGGTSAGIFDQSMGARNRVGIRLSYQPARLQYIGWRNPWAPKKFKNMVSGFWPPWEKTKNNTTLGKSIKGDGGYTDADS